MSFFEKFARSYFKSGRARGKDGARAIAIGDIHGCLDLLEEMLALVDDECRTGSDRRNFVVFLGDLIDRGPDSAGVIERLCKYSPAGVQPIFLGGNHETALLDVLDGEPGLLYSWLDFGGAECAESYGLDPKALARMNEKRGAEVLREAMPAAHVTFLANMGDTFRFGDYLFVHAGIRPGVALEAQKRRDLRWIREPFLSDSGDHSMIVVHGHTITEHVDERTNRIGIDTGAYQSGRLTALVIEGETRRYLQTNSVRIADTALPRSNLAAC